MKNKIKTCLAVIACEVFFCGIIFAQELDSVLPKPGEFKRITQEEFALELVKGIRVENYLPTSALKSDCVDLLERFGIAPLKGWKNKEFLTQEDYLVVMGKMRGKEGLINQRAIAVERKNHEIINQKWREAFQKRANWPSLNELLSDKEFFPDGPPQSPYGLKYEDRNSDHVLDEPFLPVAILIKLHDSSNP